MKHLLFIITLFFFVKSNAQISQADYKRVVVRDSMLLNGKWIKFLITDTALLNATDRDLASAKAVMEYVKNKVGAISVRDTFTTDLIPNFGTSDKFGKYGNGETIPARGKTANELIQAALIKAIPPSYSAPSANISASPSGGLYERGTALSVVLSSSLNQNDAGALTGTTYRKNGTNLIGNTDNISALTSQVGYDVVLGYAQGACKNNNLGQQDCSARINAGNTVSGTIFYTPFDKRYFGFASSTSPDNSTILALTQDANGSTGALSLSNSTPSGSQFLVYFTRGNVTSVTVNGIPATGAFTITTYSVTNAQGLAQTYSYVYSNNAFTSTVASIIFN
ncbi:MAG: hypothetical protein EAZ35_02140 [Sphingobacteriia bacterium]|nr:MAG: hypothetical protein EAZ35_02140 [Sphingobacteriia bacterium]